MTSKERNEKLDGLVEEVFKNLEDLSSLRRQLDQEMRDGFLLMAKARSNMGQKTITSLQYDEREMVPSVKADCAKVDMHQLTFELLQNTVADTDGEEQSSEQGVRKRTIEKSTNIETLGGDENESPPNKEAAKTKKVIKDPLLMFGVLVPQSLRSSKSCFQRCLPVVCKISSVQSELMRLKSEYRTLLSQSESEC